MKKYLMFAALAITLAACTSDDGPTVKDSAIQLTTRVALTRATSQNIQGTQIASGQSVWVKFTTDATAGDCDNWSSAATKEAAYTANGSGDLSTANPVKWPKSTASTETVAIEAWAPFSAAINPGTTTFTVEQDQTSEANYLASDYLYGKVAPFGHGAIASPIQVMFDHMLTKINVNITSTDPGITLAGAKIEFGPDADFYRTGTINNDGTVTVGTTNAGKVVMTTSLEAANTCSAIIIPQTIAATKQLFKITLADATPTVKQYVLNAAKTFDSKKQYTYNITISDGETIILSEQINDWTSETPESVIATN